MKTATQLAPDKAAVLAIASAAFFYHICPDGKAGLCKNSREDPDVRWPAENAANAVDILGLQKLARDSR